MKVYNKDNKEDNTISHSLAVQQLLFLLLFYVIYTVFVFLAHVVCESLHQKEQRKFSSSSSQKLISCVCCVKEGKKKEKCFTSFLDSLEETFQCGYWHSNWISLMLLVFSISLGSAEYFCSRKSIIARTDCFSFKATDWVCQFLQRQTDSQFLRLGISCLLLLQFDLLAIALAVSCALA